VTNWYCVVPGSNCDETVKWGPGRRMPGNFNTAFCALTQRESQRMEAVVFAGWIQLRRLSALWGGQLPASRPLLQEVVAFCRQGVGRCWGSATAFQCLTELGLLHRGPDSQTGAATFSVSPPTAPMSHPDRPMLQGYAAGNDPFNRSAMGGRLPAGGRKPGRAGRERDRWCCATAQSHWLIGKCRRPLQPGRSNVLV